jgi:hypothetical protein
MAAYSAARPNRTTSSTAARDPALASRCRQTFTTPKHSGLTAYCRAIACSVLKRLHRRSAQFSGLFAKSIVN